MKFNWQDLKKLQPESDTKSEAMIDSAISLVSRVRDPWPGVWIPSSAAIESKFADVDTGADPTEVESALGRPLRWATACTDIGRGGEAWLAVEIARLAKHNAERYRGLPLPPLCKAMYACRLESLHNKRPRKFIVGWDGQHWVLPRQEEDLHWVLPVICLSPGLAMASRYYWQAKFLSGHGHVVIHADARGALDLFRSRDAMPGQRRKALLHWVRGHRRRTTDGETIADVKRHLRGVRSFLWNDWQVRLDESQYEKDQAA